MLSLKAVNYADKDNEQLQVLPEYRKFSVGKLR